MALSKHHNLIQLPGVSLHPVYASPCEQRLNFVLLAVFMQSGDAGVDCAYSGGMVWHLLVCYLCMPFQAQLPEALVWSFSFVVWLSCMSNHAVAERHRNCQIVLAFEGLSMCCVMVTYFKLLVVPAVMYHFY